MLYLGSTTFFAFGIVLVLLGALQAEIAHDLTLDLAASGFLGAALALGLGLGVLVAGPLADRWPRKPLFVGACLLTLAGLASVDADHGYLAMVLSLVLIGFGCGAYDTLINAAVVDGFRLRAASALAFVHSAATLGACIGPMLVRQLLHRTGHWPDAFHGLGYAHAALAVWGASVSWHRAEAVQDVAPSAAPGLRWLRSGFLLALAVVGFAYVGTESGVTLFAVPWALARGESEAAGQWGISGFWFGLLIGRLLLAARTPQRSWQLLAANGLVGGTILIVANAVAFGPLAIATVLAGIALGPVYPLMITLAAQRFAAASGTAVGIVASAGALGGFGVPWLVGAVGDACGLHWAVALLGLHALLITLAAQALLRVERATYVASA